jgi:hypothetical protein
MYKSAMVLTSVGGHLEMSKGNHARLIMDTVMKNLCMSNRKDWCMVCIKPTSVETEIVWCQAR